MALVTEEYIEPISAPASAMVTASPPPEPRWSQASDSIDRLLAWMRDWPLWPTMAGVVVYMVVVAALDFYSGKAFPLAVLYLPAVVITCWKINLRWAEGMSLACAVLWLLVDIIQAEPDWPRLGHLWTTGSHLIFFLVVVNVIWRLRTAIEREQEAAMTDALTGLHNARWFVEQAEIELERSRRLKRPVTVVFIDCDNFKAINDTLGHRAGDRLLEVVGQTIKNCVRLVDLVARLGGDEFALVLPDVNREQAEPIVQRLQTALLNAMQREGWANVTFSTGVATFEDLPETTDDLIGAADAAMYVVKHGTKNGIYFNHDEHGLTLRSPKGNA